MLGLAGFFLTWYFIVRIVFFAIYYKSLDFEVLSYYQPFLFTPYIIAFSLITISLAIAKTSKDYLQLDRILALIFWIVNLVFSVLNKESLFMFYFRNNTDTSNTLSNLIVIEISFLLALVFTGITYRHETKGYMAYSFYALGAESFIFFLVRISVEWITIIGTYIIIVEFWLEIVMILFIVVTFVMQLIATFRKNKEEKNYS